MRTPTIHMNGSNPETLLEGLTEAYRAVDAAMRALDEAAPNGRDYYPQGPDAVQEATREHQLRAAKLRSVREELQELVVSVQDQIDEREAARARRNPAAAENGRYRYVMSCPDSTYEDIQALQESEEMISRSTFTKAIGPTAWREIQANLGYDRHFSITKDWHVGYYKGTFRGVPCYFLRHSKIEHIYTLDGKLGPSLAEED